MKQEKKLLLQMSIFFFIIFVIFGIIIIKEKQTTLFLPKIEKLVTNYINEKYYDLELIKDKTQYKNNIYITKISNPKNKNHYFLIKYKDKQITDTYKDDYQKGKTLISHLNKVIQREILKKTNNKYNVTINSSLDNFSERVKDRLLSENNLESLKIYTLEIDITCLWNKEEIIKNISSIVVNLNNNEITPKNYTILVTDQKDITRSVIIKNITYDSIKNNTLEIIISDIINNKISILTENNITYEYLN